MTERSTMGFIGKVLLFPIKLIKWLIYLLIAAFILTAIFSTPVEGISSLQRRTISQDCKTIQQALSQLQKVDSRTRSYLGTTYEALANRFILPLNLRLVKNNMSTLSYIQTDFIQTQMSFRSAYTDYMRELENLIVTDCSNHPDEFYAQLETVRIRRGTLREQTDRLLLLTEQQYDAVVELKKGLL